MIPSAIKPWVRVGQPDRPRSFDPGRVADLEYRAWVGYYLRKWPQVLAARFSRRSTRRLSGAYAALLAAVHH